ncbi:ADP-ribosylation factor-like protein 16 [Ornithodoros turicata]|uniref:ADP-ribosylation factor-like protein 16 n=1 Tax=Ornithodoros turicata TaxID=34597 RepID=UPI003139C2B9
MIICVGPTSSGKTTLLKRLQQHESGESRTTPMPSTIPTVGVNMVEVRAKQQTFPIREVGGAMAPLWAQQCSDAEGVMYIIDSANPQQFSPALIQLLQLLTLEGLQRVPFLLVFNKIDAYSCIPLNEYKSALRLNDIIHHAEQAIKVVDSSMLTGYGLDDMLEWLKNLETHTK